MIYTLDYIKKEAEGIASSWNGEDDTYFHEGDTFSEDDAGTAQELLELVKSIELRLDILKI